MDKEAFADFMPPDEQAPQQENSQHKGLPTDFPITAPPRSPPLPADDDSQLDPIVEAFDGIDELPDADPLPA